MRSARPREDRLTLGVLMMVGAALCFTAIDTSAKWLILAGLPALQVAFARYAGHFLISLVVFLPNEGLRAFHSNRPVLQFLRGLFLLFSTLLNFVALTYLPITLTTTIMFAVPLVVSLLSVPMLGEKVGPRRLSAVGIGFVGVIVAVQPWGAEFHPAMIFSLGALCCAALYFLLTRMLAGIESNDTSQLWTSGIATLALFPFVILHWEWPDTLTGYVVMTVIGLFGIVGHSVANIAHRFADASILSPVVYVQLVYATLAGLLIFGTPPTMWTVVGALIIVGSGIYIWMRERTLARDRTAANISTD
ncbi:DMT family transporter [Pseudoruegeria sp. SK021]|uniref:DMT family transporter n=1 Tax=Pseudoruegeria sp. SK021 TaxID=1933035 RepID=UPI000A239B32|nr:DMT family transporter [Pseudoruegeria sp. SK021]OSP55987.1 EamA family transporter [Pseudoruegeria sp. SK021]